MQYKNSKKISFTACSVKKKFSSEQLTSYSGLSVTSDFINHCGIYGKLEHLFPTIRHNASRFSTAQILSSILLASLCGVHRLKRIENFTFDALVSRLLKLPKNIDEDTIRRHLTGLGERGARSLHELLLGFTGMQVSHCGLSRLTLDCDSSTFTVYGNQQGAEVGYNSHKKGSKSYHPILCFVTEMKLLVNSWLRPGSAYTSNGVCEFVKETLAALPQKVEKVFFRADSGFFNGGLFNLLEDGKHEYLVKVKLKNLKDLLAGQTWQPIGPRTATCQFTHQCSGWRNPRMFYAVRIIKQMVEVDYFGEKQFVPEYEYFCYCSNLKGLDALQLHTLYGSRSESENWIEQTKNSLCAGKTITHDFWVNDILWQLSSFAYSLSVLMRYRGDFWVWRQEHSTFREWFIRVPGKVVKSGRQVTVKMPKEYYRKAGWRDFEQRITTTMTG